MEKDIRQYLHYYLGSECVVTVRGDFSENWKPEALTPYHLLPVEKSGLTAIKLILRKLNSMTDEEAFHIGKMALWDRPMNYKQGDFELSKPRSIVVGGVPNCYSIKVSNDFYDEEIRIGFTTGNVWRTTGRERVYNQNEIFHYLLRQGFDLFGLIGAGLALEKQQ